MDDYDTDDILGNSGGKKRKNSKSKGNRGESLIVKILNKRFNTNGFQRVPSSGARWSQVVVVSKDYVGDVIYVGNNQFKFCIESKIGYSEIDLCSALDGNLSKIDEFLKQAEKDAKRANKEPLLCWKKDRQPCVAFIKSYLIREPFEYYMIYKDWTATSLANLLQFPDSFFFHGV